MKILILSATENANNKAIQNAAKKKGHQCEIVSPEDIIISYESGKAWFFIKEQKIKSTYFDAIIPRLGRKFEYGCHVLECIESFTGVFSTASSKGLKVASDKLRSTIYLAMHNLPIPKTTTVQTPDNFKFLIDSVGGLPAICKSLKGSQGAGVYIFNDELQSSVTLKNFRKDKKNVLLQQFIETSKDDKKKNDIRAWVVGDKVVAAFKRLSTDDDFRSNFSISKMGEEVKLSKDEQDLAVVAAKAVGLHCAGVDIARDANDKFKPYILEINGNASLTGITKVTGIDIPAAIISFVESKVAINRKEKTNITEAVMQANAMNTPIKGTAHKALPVMKVHSRNPVKSSTNNSMLDTAGMFSTSKNPFRPYG